MRSRATRRHYWGNKLIFDRAPSPGDVPRWEALFDDVFGDEPRVRHRTFAWDLQDGTSGAMDEFVAQGYRPDEAIGLVAEPQQLVPHARENRDVVIRALDPAADEELWDAVLEVQVAGGLDDGHEEVSHRAYIRARLDDLRALFREGRGTWYVAVDPDTGDVAATCGIVVTSGRGRFQAVDTAEAYGDAASARASSSRPRVTPRRTTEPSSS